MKRIFKFIKEDVLGIKEAFKIKIEECWFNSDYYNIKFSKNNGWTWDYLLSKRLSSSGKWPMYYKEKLGAHFMHLRNILKNLDSYEDCVEYNEDVIREINIANAAAADHYNREKQAFDIYMKVFNRKNKK